jgi:hypothetical protein
MTEGREVQERRLSWRKTRRCGAGVVFESYVEINDPLSQSLLDCQ